MQNKVVINLIIICTISVFLIGCTTKAKVDVVQNPFEATAETVQATIVITKIVDKATQQPIDTNTITLRWETPTGEVINTETYRNKSRLTTTMPADGSVRLFVIVEASGYVKWENAIRIKLNSSKPFSFPVEMEK